jgi:hypothetical protein
MADFGVFCLRAPIGSVLLRMDDHALANACLCYDAAVKDCGDEGMDCDSSVTGCDASGLDCGVFESDSGAVMDCADVNCCDAWMGYAVVMDCAALMDCAVVVTVSFSCSSLSHHPYLHQNAVLPKRP